MIDVTFYQLLVTSREKTLPRLIEKIYEQGKRTLVLCESDIFLKALNSSLWTYAQGSFLPHGYEGNDYTPKDHPIWLSHNSDKIFDNVNDADVLVVTTEQMIDQKTLQRYKRFVDIFDGNQEWAVKKAQERVLFYQQQGCTITYWQQAHDATWQKAA